MKVLMRGVHLTLTDSLRDYLQEHLVSHIERYADDEAAEIDISLVDINGPKGGVDKECRATVRMPNFAAIHVTETAETLFQAIDAARDRLERSVRKAVERRREVRTDGLPDDVAANVPTY
ncbi:ribosome-associated translation inhibitor RaiA [Myxococcus sp. MISCRS1]|jgi:ribosomal subunit interface protein|uniref:ribosome hibernation-promoting factor, HPF/YfiA family n=1 Tax=Myxococcus TaxID=32 RepID=UPI001CC02B52|nr:MULTISPECIES: ribosome-associated translation inhibitor RaiA [Myxococcus]BDT36345.1 ribosome-associated translation inhibitor RaiA [Myxococcus sp. MH1]MBZ4395098.1 ribosome-associated translation inhibitor RaiA [Myxococcus sp. AS-1-15]MBZ4406892.1 ribosome-associated translation inhibitor RaiA [Myxococcus sp. XM-1-1-1]MCK8504035.1 ribosome-associated translation inhibitor RaiA [Myxococcus fulvus]MCY1002081.1 ribosome-associated translation inhibitor RaiA [Myxococcus sp. MISCRS1]